jgi:hypothetical protein
MLGFGMLGVAPVAHVAGFDWDWDIQKPADWQNA